MSDSSSSQNINGDRNQTIGVMLGGTAVYYANIVVNYFNFPAEPNSSAAPTQDSLIGANPYQGLSAFQETDGDRFFGRDLQIQELWEKFRSLHEQASTTRLLTVYGPSGSGKSSLARAGLIPELSQRHVLGYGRSRVAVLVPSSHPLESLALVLARIATNDPSPVDKTREFAEQLSQPNAKGVYDGLRRTADALLDITTSPLIVMVDQLEEVFTLCEDTQERDAFIGNLLCAAADQSKRVSVIVTLRSDFLGATQKHLHLNQLIAAQGYLVAAMTEDGLREAIAKPAELAGHALDLSTVNLLIEQTADREGALPLLQFALSQIWVGLEKGQEPAETLKAIGGVGGALAGEAQRIYDSLTSDEQAIAQRLFLGLVQLGEGTKDTRRRIPLERVVAHRDSLEQVQKVIDRFASSDTQFPSPGKRLITLANDGGAVTAEVTHEALFDNWQQLKDWLDGGHSDLRFQRRLDEAAMIWQENGKPEGNLWRSPDLDLLRQYHERSGDDMTPLQVEFFKTSQETAKKAARDKQRQRQVFVGVLSTGLALTSGAALLAAIQLRLTEMGQIKTFVALSAANAANHRELEAKIESIRAGKALKKLVWQSILPDAQLQVAVTHQLQQTVNNGQERNRLGHQGGVTSVAYRPDGKQLATSGYDGTARLWDSAGKQVAELKGHQGSIWSVAYRPDGQQLVTSGEDNTVRLWDSAGKQIAELKGHQGLVTSVVYSPNGKQLATAGKDDTVRLWDSSGKQVAELKGHQWSVDRVVYSPNGKQLATIDRSTVRLWDSVGNLVELKGHQWSVDSVAYRPDGQQLATGGVFGLMYLWDSSGKQVAAIEGHQGSVTSMVYSPDGQELATGGEDGTVRFWDSLGNQVQRGHSRGGHQGSVTSVVYRPDGQQLATGGKDDGTVRLWDSVGNQVELKEHQGGVNSVVYSPDGKQLAILGRDGIVRLWDVMGNQVVELKGHQGNVNDVFYRPDGQQLATGNDDGTVRLWDSAGKQVAELKGHKESVNRVIYRPDGQQMVTSGEDDTMRLWDSAGKQVAELKGHKGSVTRVVYKPDGQQLATSGKDGTVRLWDSAGKQVAELKGHQGHVNGVAYRPDGQQLATSGEDGTVRLWDSSGKQVAELKGHQGHVNRVIYRPDGQQLATVGLFSVRLWDSAGKHVVELKGRKGPIWSVAYSLDSQQLATGEFDGTVRLWDSSGKQVVEFKGHQGALVTRVVYSPDSKQLATSGYDGTARLWQIGGIDEMLSINCHRVRNYLDHSPTIEAIDRHLCDGIGNKK